MARHSALDRVRRELALVAGMREWARGLHGGQLVMLLLFGLPLGLVVAGGAAIAAEAAASAAETIAQGRYAGAPRVVMLAGEPYELRRSPKGNRLPPLRQWAESLHALGVSEFEISRVLRESDIADPLYTVSSLQDLKSRASLRTWWWLLSGAGFALMGFCVWALWTWMGGRKRPVEAP